MTAKLSPTGDSLRAQHARTDEPATCSITTMNMPVNNPDLLCAYGSMTERQQKLYDNLKVENRFTRFCADNDRNGNPRRIWVVSNDNGEALFAWDECYYGRNCVPGSLRRSFDDSVRVECNVSTYQMLKKLPSPEFVPYFNW